MHSCRTYLISVVVAALGGTPLTATAQSLLATYNTLYGTSLNQSQLDALEIPYDQLWRVVTGATFRVRAQFSGESLSFGLYSDPGVGSTTTQLRGPQTHNGFLSTRWASFPESSVGTTIGLYARTHVVPLLRTSEDALNIPPMQGGASGQEFLRTLRTPSPGVYLLAWEDYHGIGGDYDDVVVEINGLIPNPMPDVNADGVVNVTDLLAVISAWGPCPSHPASCTADVNASGIVDVTDLLAVIQNWG